MSVNRELLFSTLYDRLTAIPDFAFKSRLFKTYDDLAIDSQPAIIMCKGQEEITTSKGMPPIWKLDGSIYLYCRNDFDTNVYLHGYVDRLDIAPTGEVRIVDYKTGKSPKPGWEEKALFQLRVYALLYWKNTGVLPRLLQLIYLGDGRVVKSNPTKADVEAVEKVLHRVAKDIFISVEKEYWPPKPSRLCDWCYFKSICPAHND